MLCDEISEISGKLRPAAELKIKKVHTLDLGLGVPQAMR